MTDYQEFLSCKQIRDDASGFDPPAVSSHAFDFQKAIIRWACRRGRAAVFADCGLGKTLIQLDWARLVCKHTRGNILIFAPLAVASQTVTEGEKFGIPVTLCRGQDDIRSGVNITNYEMMHHFDPAAFAGVVLDESSIIKNFTGKIRNQLIDTWKTDYRLACTATPAPNDHMELGNHSEFLGAMTRQEMLAMFFVHDGGEVQKWRLKGHAETDFWRWVCSWAVMLRKPSDAGFDDGDFILPPLRIHNDVVRVDPTRAAEGNLFPLDAATLSERLVERRETVNDRATALAERVNRSSGRWVIWCNLNSESEAATKMINDAVEIRGSHSPEYKRDTMLAFTAGDIRVLVTKPKIAGHGMNWQHCARVGFLGLSDSYEQFYQAVRRCWRFGQTKPVDCYIVTASTEGAVVANVRRKEKAAEKMGDEMSEFTQEITCDSLQGEDARLSQHTTTAESGTAWVMHLGDCVDVVSGLADDSVDYSIFSPPFASLYTYTDLDRDMGNCKDRTEFYDHFKFLIPELLRATAPGRLLSFHCMNLPTSKTRDGVIGLLDFRGEMIRLFADAGWIYHSEVVIWKDPVTAMQRTKALGLLYKQLRKDSAMSRMGIPDYVVTMRKGGDNKKRIEHTHEEFPCEFWQRYASPIWSDINQSRTLQHRSVREDKDERHICPLQLDVIERCLDLWSAPGDLVLSPFAGIGSEGYCAVRKGRRFVGAELKQGYWKQAVANLKEVSGDTCTQLQMFGT